jgi:7,8-dihydropterin-6-yl-methyl-4-(beta-D-ribofuranosyl)aminobenzene 5'-phosphate synthase
MHLLPAKDDQIKEIATFLRHDAIVEYIVPAHCTGEPAFVILREVFDDKDVYAGFGATGVEETAGNATGINREDLRDLILDRIRNRGEVDQLLEQIHDRIGGEQ